MDFAQLTEPLWQTISNIVGGEPGLLTLTLSLELSAAGVEQGRRDPEFLAAMHTFVEVTLAAIVDTLHRLSAEPAGTER
jgi:hypothetical protein